MKFLYFSLVVSNKGTPVKVLLWCTTYTRWEMSSAVGLLIIQEGSQIPGLDFKYYAKVTHSHA